jgi:hypothetical protein
MNIAWITPCVNTYKDIRKYFEDIKKFNWNIHIFHNLEKMENDIGIFKLQMTDFDKMRTRYVVLHYFLDDCEECKKIDKKMKILFGQRIFISTNTENLIFRDIIFKYYEKI